MNSFACWFEFNSEPTDANIQAGDAKQAAEQYTIKHFLPSWRGCRVRVWVRDSNNVVEIFGVRGDYLLVVQSTKES